MRTSYQIKRALAKCRDDHCICDECVFSDGNVKKWRSLMSDSLIYIEQLESMQYGRWISVEERLPEHGTDVLVLTAPGTLSLGKNCVVAEYIHPRMEKSGVFINFYAGYDDKNILAVTHWMPLPEPPKEGLE